MPDFSAWKKPATIIGLLSVAVGLLGVLGPQIFSGKEDLNADFRVEPVEGTAPLQVFFLDKSAGDISSRLWEFGDGKRNRGEEPDHIYETPGTYKVKLILTGPGGESEFEREVRIFEALSVRLRFLSGAVVGKEITLRADTKGVRSFLWDFGDENTSEEAAPTHVYTKTGTYDVELTVIGADRRSQSVKKTITVLPNQRTVIRASISAPDQAQSGQTTRFRAVLKAGNAAGMIYSWNFGDRISAKGPSLTHRYRKPGTYRVTMTAKAPNGQSFTDMHSITVTSPRTAVVPNVRLMNLAKARTVIARSGLKLGKASDKGLQERIDSSKRAITLMRSKRLPVMLHETQLKALKQRTAEFRQGKTDSWKVVGQSPKAGKEVPRGSHVTLEIQPP